MHESLRVVGVDQGGRVIGTRVLSPRRLVAMPRSRWVLELPIEAEPPPIGAQLGGKPATTHPEAGRA